MSALFYFGAHPTGTQKVSDEVRSRGLNLLRVAPSSVFPLVMTEYTTPQYTIYQNNFHLFAKSVITKKPVPVTKDVEYYPLPSKTIPSCFGVPTVVWGYDEKKDSDFMQDIRDRFNATEALAKGRPCLAASLTIAQAGSLLKTDPVTTTPSSTTTINISAYLSMVRLLRIADLYLRISQYPLVKFGTEDFTLMRNFVAISNLSTATSATSIGNGLYCQSTVGTMVFNGNLPESDLAKVNYYVTAASEMTNDGGMLFPFVAELARDDDSIVPRCVERYFKQLLGNTEEGVASAFSTIKSDWGNLKMTVWGDRIAHLFAGIELSFQTGARLNILTTPASSYNGFVLYGGGFTLYRGMQEFTPVAFNELQSLFKRASPHAAALGNIFALLNYDDETDRSNDHDHVTSNYDVAVKIREHGYPMLERETLKNLCQDLMFAKDLYLPITAVNVAKVIRAITDKTAAEADFPLHRLAMLETDRTRRLLSAFGAHGPSFRVTNGRALSLETDQFTYKVSAGQGKKKREMTTTRMFCEVVSWHDSCESLAKVLVEKQVLSPIGTALANRASTASMIREFEGAGGADVLAALRTLVGVTGGSASTSGKGKRKQEDEEESRKKARTEEMAGFD